MRIANVTFLLELQENVIGAVSVCDFSNMNYSFLSVYPLSEGILGEALCFRLVDTRHPRRPLALSYRHLLESAATVSVA